MRLGLIGHPVSHSLSPAMHNAALAALGLEGRYEALDTPVELLEQRIAQVRQGWAGVNVTVPHKEAVIPWLDDLSPQAQAVGAVNTIVNHQGRLLGHNTDVEGFLLGLQESGIAYESRQAVVLGAGGAARAIVYGLRQAGCTVAVANRSLERANSLAQEMGASALGLESPDLFLALQHCDLLVNTTSVGLKDPQASPLPGGVLPRKATVVDIVYNPLVTRLMRDAREAGLAVLGGLPMLVWQGALAFEKWCGVRPPVEVMYRAAREALGA